MEFIVTYEDLEKNKNERFRPVVKTEKVLANSIEIVNGKLLLMESGQPNAVYSNFIKCIREDKIEE